MEAEIKKGRVAASQFHRTHSITGVIWELCDGLKKNNHVEVSCHEDEVSRVRTAVYRYRKESGTPIHCTLKQARGKNYERYIQYMGD